MRNWYDKEEDILGIQIKEGEYWKSIELARGVVIDISKDLEIIGMEIHKASRIFSGDIKRVIEIATNHTNK